ncbi:MAG: WG repeat-containing protein [Clostridia bacterium]|nr:WG repeat-containing protein [Clostridia bacterium]
MKQVKQIVSLFLIGMLMNSALPAMAEDSIRVLLNGQEIAFDVPPRMINDRTMVPLRVIFEALGANVDWKDEIRTVTAVKENITIRLTVDEAVMYVNDTPVSLDSPACIVNDRTLVPLRGVSEAFGISVDWFGDKRTVTIGSDDGVYEDPLFHNGLVMVQQDGKWGYVNKKGELVIPCQFSEVQNFYEERAVITDSYVETSDLHFPYSLPRFSYIDMTGERITEELFDGAEPFSQGLAAVKTNGKWGYINKNGTLVIPPQFDDADHFCEGLAAVSVDGKYGYINQKGEFVVIPQFDYAHSFSEGLALVENEQYNSDNIRCGSKYGYLDKNGEVVIPLQFDYAYHFSEGLALVAVDQSPLPDDSKWGYINQKGEFAVEAQFAKGSDFSEGLARVGIKPDGNSNTIKYGYIDKTGNLMIPCQFDDADDFSNGVALVSMIRYNEEAGLFTAQYGYIDRNGQYVVEPYLDNANPFAAKVTLVDENGQLRYINTDGSKRGNLPTGKFYDIVYEDGYLIHTTADNKKCIMDINGNLITDEYDSIVGFFG